MKTKKDYFPGGIIFGLYFGFVLVYIFFWDYKDHDSHGLKSLLGIILGSGFGVFFAIMITKYNYPPIFRWLKGFFIGLPVSLAVCTLFVLTAAEVFVFTVVLVVFLVYFLYKKSSRRKNKMADVIPMFREKDKK